MSAALSCDGCAAQWMIRSKRFFSEQRHTAFAVSNVERHGSEMLCAFLEPLEIPQCVPRRTEEHAAHVVVHADYFVTLTIEVLDGFRANQAAAPSNENIPGFHYAAPCTVIEKMEPQKIAAIFIF